MVSCACVKLTFVTTSHPISAARATRRAASATRHVLPLEPAQSKGAELAATSASWNDANEWCARLNRWLVAEQGQQAAQLSLPSESQWELACRAGSSSPFHFGATLDGAWANYNGNYVYGSGEKGAYLRAPPAVGSYGLVNRWGLADLHGQVWEWCADLWHPSVQGAPSDGSAWLQVDPSLNEPFASCRLLRGGSWNGSPGDCRSAYRNHYKPVDVSVSLGFRVVCLPQGLLLSP